MSEPAPTPFTTLFLCSVVVVVGLLLRSFVPQALASGADPPFSQRASELPGRGNPLSSGPSFNTAGIDQRNQQIRLLADLIEELRRTRALLEQGTVAVTVTSPGIDYPRLAELIAEACHRSDRSAGAATPLPRIDDPESVSPERPAGTGGIRRLDETPSGSGAEVD